MRHLITHVVATCARRPWVAIVLASALGARPFAYTATHVAIDTDGAALTTADAATRNRARVHADAFECIGAGQLPAFSWRSLIEERAPERRELRRFVLVQPVLDYSALQPGERASAAIRNIARELEQDADSRIRIRLTGPVPLA